MFNVQHHFVRLWRAMYSILHSCCRCIVYGRECTQHVHRRRMGCNDILECTKLIDQEAGQTVRGNKRGREELHMAQTKCPANIMIRSALTRVTGKCHINSPAIARNLFPTQATRRLWITRESEPVEIWRENCLSIGTRSGSSKQAVSIVGSLAASGISMFPPAMMIGTASFIDSQVTAPIYSFGLLGLSGTDSGCLCKAPPALAALEPFTKLSLVGVTKRRITAQHP